MTAWAQVIRTEGDRERAVRMLRSLPIGERFAYSVAIDRQQARGSDAQRRLLFALCRDIAQQLPFPGGGTANAGAWKDFLTGLLRGERMARDGQVVVIIGGGVSGATRQEMSELIEFISAYGAQRGVRFVAVEDNGRNAECPTNA